LSPPERVIVLCVDEKSQVQALDRTQPLLPMRPGQVEAAHARLQAAWHDIVVRGAIVGKCMPATARVSSDKKDVASRHDLALRGLRPE
jgi:hypothetical protein